MRKWHLSLAHLQAVHSERQGMEPASGQTHLSRRHAQVLGRQALSFVIDGWVDTS